MFVVVDNQELSTVLLFSVAKILSTGEWEDIFMVLEELPKDHNNVQHKYSGSLTLQESGEYIQIQK